MNFTNNDVFLTLTFNDNNGIDLKNVQACNVLFRKAMKRIKRKYGDFPYLAVIEFQDTHERGAVHYHMMCKLPTNDIQTIERLWGYGFCRTEKIYHVDNLGAYLVKYMSKSFGDKRLQEEKGYLCSKGLKRPEEFAHWDFDEDTDKNRPRLDELSELIKGKLPTYASSYTDEHCGTVQYKQYNINRIIPNKE